MLNFILNIFYPNKCMFCNEFLDNNSKYYCKKCYYKLPFTEDKICLICGREVYGTHKICLSCRTHKTYIDVNYPAFTYSGNIEEALKKFKFAGKMWYYKPFAKLMYENIKDKVSNIDYIVYPPINKKTFYKRGYNQMELISKEMSKLLNIKMLKNCIYKTRENEKQSLTSGKLRYQNVRGVFAINNGFSEIINGRNILLLDDVMTTGATINECARMLKKSGAKSVVSSTLCIVK